MVRTRDGRCAHVVGREGELATLRDFLAGDEPRRALLLTGTPGIGRTARAVEAGIEVARGRGLAVLDARPSGAETQLAFAALADLLDGLDDDALGALAPPRRRALEVALLRADAEERPPELRRRPDAARRRSRRRRVAGRRVVTGVTQPGERLKLLCTKIGGDLPLSILATRALKSPDARLRGEGGRIPPGAAG